MDTDQDLNVCEECDCESCDCTGMTWPRAIERIVMYVAMAVVLIFAFPYCWG